MSRRIPCIAVLVSLVLLSGFCPAEPRHRLRVRMPSAAGTYYPDDPGVLLNTLKGFFDAADTPEVPDFLAGCIVSPAPYGLAGPVTAHAFKSLQPGQYDRVIILTPSHTAQIENCSIAAVDAYVTPLGPVPLDAEAARTLLFSPLFTSRSLQYRKVAQREQVHEYEYGDEALLPYLQERLREFKIVPIVVGKLTDATDKLNPGAVEGIVDALKPLLDGRTLVVASSSFTHFGNDFSNRPFNDNIVEGIEHLDRQAFELVLARDMNGFERYLTKTKNVIDGARCIQILMRLFPERYRSRILAYEVSGVKTGDLNRSISFAAFTFHDPARPAAEARPDRVRPLPIVLQPPVREGTDSGTPPVESVPQEGKP